MKTETEICKIFVENFDKFKQRERRDETPFENYQYDKDFQKIIIKYEDNIYEIDIDEYIDDEDYSIYDTRHKN
jgi:hypothetical protein